MNATATAGPSTRPAAAYLDLARRTVETITRRITAIAETLEAAGADRDRAITAATAHVLATMATEPPSAFGAYVRAAALLELEVGA
ncbi:hypothetical protein Psi02_72420 [Planotetraspora silvatica]|uniref:Uncharacterized protein n=1 Tax=Planotetraspora silvatica TaxID=234614 RepID=A0A8J3URM9_9ACTN|nr:hypothetical protein [Planotetraspora silvatica]GII50818.1 hypothetical protein Psi02_72420 [Planotetraspora silvatica]